MTYIEILIAAKAIRAGDTGKARDLLLDIGHTLDTEAISSDERRKLYKLRNKWTDRAEGKDSRWNVHGSTPGNKRIGSSSSTAPSRVRKTGSRFHDADSEEDPLVASILRKYGTPVPEEEY